MGNTPTTKGKSDPAENGKRDAVPLLVPVTSLVLVPHSLLQTMPVPWPGRAGGAQWRGDERGTMSLTLISGKG